ncbi:MAG: acyl-CoA thioesterase [Bacteroidales bacterium]|nr:acyl-CoA thioesterase [Candidatus Liminaster caballi]
MTKKYLFESIVKIRDFECDMQGVVNNAYYHNLLMQTRTEFLESIGIIRNEWSVERGIDFVVYETAIQYRSPIVAGETFRSCLNMHREGARYIYIQDFRRESGELCMRARVDVAVGLNGKLTRGEIFADYMKEHGVEFQEQPASRRTNSKIPNHIDDVIYDYEMKVRDYECDRYGSATNAFVQRYLEVTRLEFMEEMGETFRKWHENGVDMMVSKVDLKFIRPMMAAEKFHSLMNIRQDGPRVIFEQEIRRKNDMQLCVRASVEIVGIVDGELDTQGACFFHFINNQVPEWHSKNKM